MLNSISDKTLILIVFSIITILNIIAIYRKTYYSNNKKSDKAMVHVLNSKYKLYKIKVINISFINMVYGVMNIILSVTAPFIILYLNPTIGIIYYISGMIIGNIIVNQYIISKYLKFK
ncbi:hypothetical protein [Anaerofustis stercorihominis]|uniref:hypothetical protein n=1 Tax=Anaerofustis stercorihominis TaxID=214853 RepID=UPI00214B5FFC|nr:hypothetical protein [Anaerofustis stercorihominis]MCR2032951.1 hypothetical protein [Anaerofustis stercorihominis]